MENEKGLISEQEINEAVYQLIQQIINQKGMIVDKESQKTLERKSLVFIKALEVIIDGNSFKLPSGTRRDERKFFSSSLLLALIESQASPAKRAFALKKIVDVAIQKGEEYREKDCEMCQVQESIFLYGTMFHA